MKIICIDTLTRFFVKADTTLLRDDEPYFDPNFGSVFSQTQGRAVRITRIVKCIEARFAYRAWSEWFCCVEHRVNDVDEQMGRNFDRSFAVDGRIFDKTTLSEADQLAFDQAISYVTKYISLRVGDYVFVPDEVMKKYIQNMSSK
ncbi:MAG: hypothetical protein RR980_05105 [Mucinivorans sp.]